MNSTNKLISPRTKAIRHFMSVLAASHKKVFPMNTIFKLFLSLFLISIISTNPLLASTNYDEVKVEVEKTRAELGLLYRQQSSSVEKEQLLTNAGLELQKLVVQSLAPPWYGTKWTFHGTSEEPGKGAIACGYFITTLLRDVGVKLDRVKLAQQASENIIKSLVSRGSIKRFSNKPLKYFLSDVKELGEGLFIVGLDYHVGFISVESSGIFFIHSSYQQPYAVTRELASKSQILNDSKYRVIGKLNDKKFLTAWLSGETFETVGK